MGSKQLLLLKMLLQSIDNVSTQLDQLRELSLHGVTGLNPNDTMTDRDWAICLGRLTEMQNAHTVICNGSTKLEKLIRS